MGFYYKGCEESGGDKKKVRARTQKWVLARFSCKKKKGSIVNSRKIRKFAQ
jgi:hypothetical protein